MIFRRKNKNFVTRQKRIEEYAGAKKKRKFGLVFRSPIAAAKNLPGKYANSAFGRPFKQTHISVPKILLVLFAIALLVYILLFSSLFKIRTIKLVNNNILIEGDVSKFLEDLQIKEKNLFLLDTNQVRSAVVEFYKRVEDVRVYKIFPSKLRIKVIEKPSTIIWSVNDTRYLLDNGGIVITEIVEDLGMPIVKDFSNLPVSMGSQIVAKNFIDFVNTVDSSLEKRFGLGVVGYSVDQTTFELKAHINSGFYILFDTTMDAIEQLDKLSKVYQEGEMITEYVILSIDGRVVVK